MYEKSLSLLEDSFDRYLKGTISIKELINKMELGLVALTPDLGKKKFIVQLSKREKNDKFFGYRIFPDIGAMDDLCRELAEEHPSTNSLSALVKKWKYIPGWVIEMDECLFDRISINFTPKELLAMLLHEVGHILYSDSPVEAFYRSYKEARIRMTASEKATQRAMYSIYMIPLSIACFQRKWFKSSSDLRLEMIADGYVAEFGYRDAMISALSKIVKTYGSSNDTAMYHNNVAVSIGWCHNNIADVAIRRDTLKDELYYQGIKTNSNYIKAVSINVIKTLGMKMRERYTGAVVEATVGMLETPGIVSKYELIIDTIEYGKFDNIRNGYVTNSIATESLFNQRKKIKVVLPSQYEIDTLSIEIDKITNHHDRVFVLDLLYEILERIAIFEETVTKDPALYNKWIGKITSMQKEVELLRQSTLAKKYLDKQYKFFVKYPAGYEG